MTAQHTAIVVWPGFGLGKHPASWSPHNGQLETSSANFTCRNRPCQSTCECCGMRDRRIHSGRTAPSLPAQARSTSAGRCPAGFVPPIVVRSRRYTRAPPRPRGSITTNEQENNETMSHREQCRPGAARGAQVRKDPRDNEVRRPTKKLTEE
jgi:hypothetical protein